ncbi:MAG: hypothetical protein SGPRY_010243 [Prymnesium sp.]
MAQQHARDESKGAQANLQGDDPSRLAHWLQLGVEDLRKRFLLSKLARLFLKRCNQL